MFNRLKKLVLSGKINVCTLTKEVQTHARQLDPDIKYPTTFNFFFMTTLGVGRSLNQGQTLNE